MNEQLRQNTHSKEFNDAVGLAYSGENARENSEALKADLKKKTISDIGRDALSQAQVSQQHLSDKRFAKARDIFNDEELGSTTETKDKDTSFEQKVETSRQALAEKYNLNPEEFTLVETQNKDGEAVHTLVYSANNGIDLGDKTKDYDPRRSYNSVMADNDTHLTQIDGEQVDTRTGMTESTYKAMIEQARQNNLPLPDSNDTQDNGVWTATWLTGDRADADFARSAVVRGGDRVVSGWARRACADRALRFRPAVVIDR